MPVSVNGEEGREHEGSGVVLGREGYTMERGEGLKEGWTKNWNVSTAAFGQGGSGFNWWDIMAGY